VVAQQRLVDAARACIARTGLAKTTIDGDSKALFGLYADEMRPWLEGGQQLGLLRSDVTPDEFAELTLRITLSMLTTEGPVHRDADELRRYVTMFLTPALAPPE